MGLNNWLTINEIRAREGLQLVEGGDALYVPSLDNPIGIVDDSGKVKAISVRSIEVKRPKVSKRKDWKEKTAKTQEEKSLAAKAVDKYIKETFNKKTLGMKLVDETTKSAYIESWKKKMGNTKPMIKALVSFFDDQQDEVLSNLKDELKGLRPKEFVMKAVADMLFDMTDATKLAVNIAMPILKDWIASAGADAAKLAGGTFSPATSLIESWTKNRAQYFATTINQTTQDALTTTLTEGLANKENIQDLSARIATVYDQAKNYRTDMIARTETSAASNYAAGQAYQQAGIERQQWVVVSPEDEDCIENDGDIEDIDGGVFPSGDNAPPVHPNCQCTTIPVFDDEDTDDNQ